MCWSGPMLDALEQHVSEQNAEMRAKGEMAEQIAEEWGTDFLAELERPVPRSPLA